MSPSNELFDLIKSLSKSEKRYFKLLSSLQSGEKNYMKLFDAIEAQKEYDEEAIKSRFENETFIGHLPSEKNHLYQRVLKSLRSYYSEKSSSSLLHELLRNVEILFDKALYNKCYKLNQKAKSLAYDYEEFRIILECIKWEKVLVEEGYVAKEGLEILKNLTKEEKECINELNCLASYQNLWIEVKGFYEKNGQVRNLEQERKVDHFMNNRILSGVKDTISIRAKVYYHLIIGLCELTKRNIENACLNFNSVIELFDRNSFMLKVTSLKYIDALSYLFLSHVLRHDWALCNDITNRMTELERKKDFSSLSCQIRLFKTVSNCKLLLCIHKGSDDQTEKYLIPAIEEGLKKYTGKIRDDERVELCYNLARVYFNCRDYRNALRCINIILNQRYIGYHLDRYAFANLMNLIIHAELGNQDLLRYTVKSVRRFLVKNEHLYGFESVFLKNFNRLIKVNRTEEKRKIYIDFKNELKNTLGNGYDQVAHQYFNFIPWLEYKSDTSSPFRVNPTEKRVRVAF